MTPLAVVRSRVGAGIAIVLALALVGALLLLRGGDDERHLVADFPNTINLYEGAQVKVLGVRVGTVEDVAVRGTSVRVSIAYDSEVELPADVSAMIVPPSIVGDRFVQLAPAYDGGPLLADDARLGLDRTAVPVELGDTYRQLDSLATALGPKGANQDGSLSKLLKASSDTLDGNGKQFNRDISQLADGLDTLAAADDSYQGTVDNVGTLTQTLLEDDAEVRRLVLSLARVSGQLNAQRQDIATASRQLNSALGDVARFTRANRGKVTKSITGIRRVSAVLNKHLTDIDDLLSLAPVGFVDAMNINFPTNYDPDKPGKSTPKGRSTSFMQRGIYTANFGVQLSSTLETLCATVTGPQAERLDAFCQALAAAGNDLGLLLSELSFASPTNPPALPPDLKTLPRVLERLRAASGVTGGPQR